MSIQEERWQIVLKCVCSVLDYLPPDSSPTLGPAKIVRNAIVASVADLTTFKMRRRCAPHTYRELRDFLDTRPSRAMRLFVVLLLHSANEPEDEQAHTATVALFQNVQIVETDIPRRIVQANKRISFRGWTPATGPPFRGAEYIPDPSDLPLSWDPFAVLLKAGSASLARPEPFSGDCRATAGAALLRRALEGFQPTPPISQWNAECVLNIWVSYPDILLRSLRSPFDLSERDCMLLLNCLGWASAILFSKLYQLDPMLEATAVQIFKRDLPAIMDTIALHPEWEILFPATERLAVALDEWLPRNNPIERPHAEGVMRRLYTAQRRAAPPAYSEVCKTSDDNGQL